MFDLNGKYDDIVIADARYADYKKIGKFNLVIAADMLEHMEKHEAKELILELLNHTDHLLICFPLEHHDQHAGDEGNDFESHIDHWHFEEMQEFLQPYKTKELQGEVLAYFLVDNSL